jgi:hypothetical protein
MKSGNLAVVALAGLLGVGVASLTGCEADGEARDAAYPEPIGYTPPSVATAAPAPAALPPGPPAAPADGLAVGGEAADQGTYDDTDPSALSDFRGALEPYGTWTDDSTYGTVWIPSESVVGPDFTPYVSAGHWTYDDDYAWASDYDWGWAPFHYGRWAYADGPGWEWIPGRQYAGAWVSWRVGGEGWGYVGWAPLSPTWCWRGGAAIGLGYVPRAPYAFVGTANLFGPSLGPHLVGGAQAGTVGAHTTPYVPSGSASSGRVVAHPTVGGPPPSSMQIADSAVVHASQADARGLAQARAYARPSTAMALGGRAPVGYASGGSAARTAYASPSHFGGRLLGGGFSGSATSARPMATPYYGARGTGNFASPSQASSVTRGYAAPRGMSSPSGYGGHSGGAGAFRGSSAPSGFHGGGGGGGGHGGGGGGHGGGHR